MPRKAKIILAQDVERLGMTGQAKTVALGYARNYLVPRRLAYFSDDAQAKVIILKLKKKYQQKKKEIVQLKQQLSKLEEMVLKFKERVTKNDKLYAKITPLKIAEKIKKEFQVVLDKKKIKIPEIKKIGQYEGEIDFGEKLKTKFKILVEKKTAADKAQTSKTKKLKSKSAQKTTPKKKLPTNKRKKQGGKK